MMRFTLDLESLDGTNMQRRIEQLRAEGEQAWATYKLKEHSRKKQFNKARKWFTDDQYNYVKTKLRKHIWLQGYVNYNGNERTGFFEYDDATEEEKASFMSFR